MSEPAKCQLCGEPMPPGEEVFNYHGYSGPCPKPPMHPKVCPKCDNLLPVSGECPWCKNESIKDILRSAYRMRDDVLFEETLKRLEHKGV